MGKELKSQIWSTFLKTSGVVMWAILIGLVLLRTVFVESIFLNQLVYLGLAAPAILLGISSMVAGVILLDKFSPFFDFGELFKGDGYSKIAGAMILSAMLLSLAIVLYGAF